MECTLGFCELSFTAKEDHLLLLDYAGLVVSECISSVELVVTISDHLVLLEDDIMLVEGEAFKLSVGHELREGAVIVAVVGQGSGRSSRRHGDAEGLVVFRGASDAGVWRERGKKRLVICFNMMRTGGLLDEWVDLNWIVLNDVMEKREQRN